MKKFWPIILLALFLSGCGKCVSVNRVGPVSGDGITHRSFLLDRDFFSRAYYSGRATTVKEKVTAGIIPHHLLAAYLIGDFFRGLQAYNQPSTVVLIGPNHANFGRSQIISSQGFWRTPYGYLDPDFRIINALVKKDIVTVEEGVFISEHSISAEVAFIKKSFPRAKIVPIILKNSTSEQKAEQLAAALSKILPRDALVVASLDFSHYVSPAEARRQNKVNIEILKRNDPAEVADMFVDSRPTAQTLMYYLKEKGFHKPLILSDSNTAEVIGNPDLAEVTSYITAYYYR
ncbi:MAG: AmmeMemoRadiSam system protein B [Patescibacteria group bacterium]